MLAIVSVLITAKVMYAGTRYKPNLPLLYEFERMFKGCNCRKGRAPVLRSFDSLTAFARSGSLSTGYIECDAPYLGAFAFSIVPG